MECFWNLFSILFRWVLRIIAWQPNICSCFIKTRFIFHEGIHKNNANENLSFDCLFDWQVRNKTQSFINIFHWLRLIWKFHVTFSEQYSKFISLSETHPAWKQIDLFPFNLFRSIRFEKGLELWNCNGFLSIFFELFSIINFFLLHNC